MTTQQPEQPAKTLKPNAAQPTAAQPNSTPLPTTDVTAEDINPNKLISLTVDERFLLRLLLPPKGNRRAMAIAASIDTMIDFDEAEAIQYGIRMSDDGNLFFNQNGLTSFPFNADQVALIKQAVEVADAENRIAREMLTLLDKIDSL